MRRRRLYRLIARPMLGRWQDVPSARRRISMHGLRWFPRVSLEKGHKNESLHHLPRQTPTTPVSPENQTQSIIFLPSSLYGERFLYCVMSNIQGESMYQHIKEIKSVRDVSAESNENKR